MNFIKFSLDYVKPVSSEGQPKSFGEFRKYLLDRTEESNFETAEVVWQQHTEKFCGHQFAVKSSSRPLPQGQLLLSDRFLSKPAMDLFLNYAILPNITSASERLATSFRNHLR